MRFGRHADHPSSDVIAHSTPVTVTIRGINSASPGTPVGIQGEFNIAPVVATGSMVFWTVNSGNVTADSSKLLGFGIERAKERCISSSVDVVGHGIGTLCVDPAEMNDVTRNRNSKFS